MRKKKKFSGLTLMCLPMLACGSSGGSSNKISLVDAAGSGHVFKDAPAVAKTCDAKTSYSPTFGSNDVQQATAGSAGGGPKVQYLGNLTEANPIDLLDIELWLGSGGDFPSALATGTYDLSAKGDSDYNQCDSCVVVFPQVPVGSDGSIMVGSDTEQYMAKSGSLHLTSVATNLTGTLTNVVLRLVDYDGSGNQSDDPLNCTTTITSLSFTAPIMAAQFDSQKNGYHLSLRNRHR